VKATAWPPKGSGRGGGDSVARASALLQALETGTCRIAGHLPDFEAAAVTWQAGQHQPDSLAALVVAYDVLVHTAGRRVEFAVPTGSLSLGRSISDRAAITSMEGWLRRRLG
jgi:hypothetical protein